MERASVERPETVARAGRPDYPQMGERLRARRQELGLSLRDLAQRLGVSPSLISQIERGRANPSVSTLYAIVAELDISLDELLFDRPRMAPAGGDGDRPGAAGPGAAEASIPEVPSGPVLAAHQRKRIRLASGVIWERLTTRSEPGTEFLYVIYEVGGASSPEDAYQRHAGHEWGYVLSGSLQVTIGFNDYVLQPGDAVSLDSTTPHRLVNVGDTPVHAIWFVQGRDPHDAARREENAREE
ncbi:MAG TPA: XRE family transcriptional regulator [candidate division Zixibacteria bacterium]|nr:XRE family transcriptional regulator [candidate division Zixibacteria bacterium]